MTAPATIFALASAPGRAGVAVVRLSGAAAPTALEKLTGRALPMPRQAAMRRLQDPTSGALLDQALVVYFAAPASFTGEDVVELHLHGGRAVIDGVLAALMQVEGCRLAAPGEFTRRAFENGKLDLTAAEAVADLIAAETEAQRCQALDQLGGSLAALYSGFSDRLAKALAHIEADIEFPDEDMPAGVSGAVLADLRHLQADLTAHLADARRGERLRDGLQVAIIGAPNAGKSSLLNALARREAAIVSDEAGTTRDVIEVALDIGGYPVILADTAGLRATDNRIEAEGIRRADARAQDADIKLVLFDGQQTVPDHTTMDYIDQRSIVVLTKQDLSGQSALRAALPPALAVVATHIQDEGGMAELMAVLQKTVADFFGTRRGAVPTRERHRAALAETLGHLERALGDKAKLPELVAEDVRLALRALGSITGRVHIEDLLDRIFKDFCIGK